MRNKVIKINNFHIDHYLSTPSLEAWVKLILTTASDCSLTNFTNFQQNYNNYTYFPYN